MFPALPMEFNDRSFELSNVSNSNSLGSVKNKEGRKQNFHYVHESPEQKGPASPTKINHHSTENLCPLDIPVAQYNSNQSSIFSNEGTFLRYADLEDRFKYIPSQNKLDERSSFMEKRQQSFLDGTDNQIFESSAVVNSEEGDANNISKFFGENGYESYCNIQYSTDKETHKDHSCLNMNKFDNSMSREVPTHMSLIPTFNLSAISESAAYISQMNSLGDQYCNNSVQGNNVNFTPSCFPKENSVDLEQSSMSILRC